MMKKILLLFFVGLFIAGCVQPVQKLGCCMKANLSEDAEYYGCVLYNMSDHEFYDLIPNTIGLCDDEESGTDGHCNVSFGTDILGNEITHLVPICSEDELGTCFEPDCKAMVCGDFKYTPRVSPGFTSVDDMAGQIPPDTEGEAQKFYEAQCRFLDMDAKLTTTMRNSNSMINVFRIGLGESFVEYDHYRYYLPISDKFCSIDIPLSEGAKRVDRYMNYIGPGYARFDPINGITQNCLIDDEEIPLPFRFGYSDIDDATDLGAGFYEYDITDPDRSGYKFKEYARTIIPLGPLGFTADPERALNFKSIDEDYYRKALSIAYIDEIYDEDIGRAPFECDTQSIDCYSGTCDPTFYNRGVLLKGSADEPGEWEAAVTDCTLETDVTGKRLVICAPTISASRSGADVDVDYANVLARLWHVRVEVDDYDVTDINQDDANPPENVNGCCGESWCGDDSAGDLGQAHVCGLRWIWDDITGNTKYSSCEGRTRWGTDARRESDCDADDGCACGSDGIKHNAEVFLGATRIKAVPDNFGMTSEDPEGGSCPAGCAWNDYHDKCFCTVIIESSEFPPAAQIEFFGKFGESPHEQVIWEEGGEEHTVLGYALVAPGDFEDTLLVQNCNMDEDDYIRISMDIPLDDYHDGPSEFTKLIWAFKPYFEHRLDVLRTSNWGDGAGDLMHDGDIIFSSIPWIIAYQSGKSNEDGFQTRMDFYHANDPTSYYLKRNYYDLEVPYTYSGVSSEDLRRARSRDDLGGGWRSYLNLMASHVYLFVDKDNDDRLGECMLDKSTGLPMVKTYGWCESCTVSTLAYQEVRTGEDLYIPNQNINLEGRGARVTCQQYSPIHGHYVISCDDSLIHDISVYQGPIADDGGMLTGGPRTIPEASYMKEKLEIFMKSGIMPVIDLSDGSNWEVTVYSDRLGHDVTYPEFDSRKLLDNKGAMIVIVDTVEHRGEVDPLLIGERANSVRISCPRCLTAVRLRELNNDSFAAKIDDLFSDPRNLAMIDIIAFDYSPNWGDEAGTYTADDSVNRSIEVVDDLSDFARIALLEAGKPTIITNFQVSEGLSEAHGSYWNADTFDTLFSTVISSQDKLVKSGLIGIIFTSARSDYDVSDAGMLDVQDGIGYKDQKFCGFGVAATRMTSLPETSIMSPILLQESVNCTRCTSLEISMGTCADGAAMGCDNGVACDIPMDSGITLDNAKCPEDTIAGECQLCSELEGKYVCDYHYSDGTYEQQNFSSFEVDSDIYGDVVAGLERPNKCCLQMDEQRYSYAKKAMPNPVNRPVVFSESGNQLQDCGMVGSLSGLSDLGFCGQDLALQNYNVNCTFVAD